MNKVKTIQYEKKFKKKDGSYGIVKIEYAKCGERIKEFRSTCPNGKFTTELIQTTPDTIVKATVIQDKSNPNSPEATAHSSGKKDIKSIEKHETLAIGRALANLGFLANGEVASLEEMEDYEKLKQERTEVEASESIKEINACKTLDELKACFIALPNKQNPLVVAESQEKAKLLKTK